MDYSELEVLIEGVLFAAGDVISIERLSVITSLDKKTLRRVMNNMISSYNNSRRGLMIREINDGFQLSTRPEHSEYIKQLFEPRQRQGLSQAALETLSIIAYKQPITKAGIEHIRGVSSESAVTRLLDRNLIHEFGRMDAPGKPILYATTDEFLRAFGFKSAKDLPPIDLDNADEQNPFGQSPITI